MQTSVVWVEPARQPSGAGQQGRRQMRGCGTLSPVHWRDRSPCWRLLNRLLDECTDGDSREIQRQSKFTGMSMISGIFGAISGEWCPGALWSVQVSTIAWNKQQTRKSRTLKSDCRNLNLQRGPLFYTLRGWMECEQNLNRAPIGGAHEVSRSVFLHHS